MKKILFIASECVPFVKTGGLADVVGSLPKAFDKEKYEVRVIIPNYKCIKPEWKEKMNFVTSFYMDMAWRSQYVGIMEMKYDGIQYYFIDNEYYLPVRNHTDISMRMWKNLLSFQRRHYQSACDRISAGYCTLS